jgi:hypothetical protein
MYRVPLDLDLSKIVGEFATQVGVGQFDLQFTFGPVNFAIQSPVTLSRNGEVVGGWKEGQWPDATFYDVMNSSVIRWEIPDDRRIVIHLANGLAIHLNDDSDQYECMQISFEGDSGVAII